MLLEMSDRRNNRLNLRVRVYNEGVAFRYEIPAQANFDGFQLAKDGEKTAWRFPENAEFVLTRYDRYVTSQECKFNPTKLSDVRRDEYIGMPAIVRVKGQVLALTEACGVRVRLECR